MANEELQITITLDNGSVIKGLGQVNKVVEQTGKNVESAFSSPFQIKGLADLKAGFDLASLAARKLFDTLGHGIDEAIQAEGAVKRFNLALANNGLYSEQTSKSFLDYADSLEKTRAISADVILEQSALLVSLGRLSGQGLERATNASLDLAAGLGIDTSSAFELLAKAAAGNTAALSRYGIKIDETLPKSQRFAGALAIIEQKFGGQGAQAADTFAGSLAKVDLQFKNVLQALGELVTKSPAIKETLNIAAILLGNFSKTLESLSNQGFVDSFVLKLADIGLIIAKYILPVVETFVKNFVIGFQTIGLSLNVLAVGVSGLASLLVNSFVEVFSTIATGYAEIVGLVNSDLGNKLKSGIANIANGLTAPLNNEFEATKERASKSFGEISARADTAFNGEFSGSVAIWLENYKSQIEQAKIAQDGLGTNLKNNAREFNNTYVGISQGFQQFVSGFETAATDFAATANKNFAEAGKAAFQTFGQGVGQAFSNVGKALQKGEDGLKAFGDALLQTIGQIAVQLGTTFILQGLAYLFAGLPNGPSLIAAGGALAVAGGVLAASGGGSASASGAGGGGVAASPSGGGVATAPGAATDVVDNKPVEPVTKVAVTIQGNVFDTAETGLRITQILNDAFDQQGVAVRTA
jgi:hypothetical protein